VKKINAFLLVVVIGMVGEGAVAQEFLVPPSNIDAPSIPDLDLPDLPDAPSAGLEGSGTRLPQSPQFEPIPEGESDEFDLLDEGKDYQLFDSQPALMESTGSWLRRGFWYTEIDAVILNRDFDRNMLVLIEQRVGTGQFLDGFGRPINNNLPRTNDLSIAGHKPGAEGVPRVKLGRFLFRDQNNRDHTAEFTLYGGGQWSQQASLDAVTVGADFGTTSLTVPTRISRGNPAFDGATSSQFIHESRFNSVELNYHLKSRMHRDRMAMRPNGEWVRMATPTRTRSLLVGLRYFDLTENLSWDAFGVPDTINGGGATVNGNYLVRTDNDMIGIQIGHSQTYETSRWSLGLLAKAGGMLNEMTLDSSFSGTDSLTSGTTRSTEDTLSMLAEIRLTGKWHLRPNFSLRAGLELLYVDSIALTPFQLNFVPGGNTQIVSSTNSLFLGTSVGFEGYW